MKTNSKTMLSCMAAGLLLSVFSAVVLAQTNTPSDQPLTPEALEALCKVSPSDARCVKEGTMTPEPTATESPTTEPVGGGSPEATPPAASGSETPNSSGETTVPAPIEGGTPVAPPTAPTGGATTPPAGTTP